MHLAMADGNRNIVMILLQKKLDVHIQNRQGLTPLFCAVLNGHRSPSRPFRQHQLRPTPAPSPRSAVIKLLCSHDISVLGTCSRRRAADVF